MQATTTNIYQSRHFVFFSLSGDTIELFPIDRWTIHWYLTHFSLIQLLHTLFKLSLNLLLCHALKTWVPILWLHKIFWLIKKTYHNIHFTGLCDNVSQYPFHRSVWQRITISISQVCVTTYHNIHFTGLCDNVSQYPFHRSVTWLFYIFIK